MTDKDKPPDEMYPDTKRITRVSLIAILAAILFVVLLVFGFYVDEYVTHDLPASKVEVTVKIDKQICADPKSPVVITVGNASRKTILNTSVYLRAYRKGHSTNLASREPIEVAYTIPPTEGIRHCTLPELNLSAPEGMNHADLIWEVERYKVLLKK